jgi:DNA invertase Pin-like site-specific DNA recombinase
MTLSIPSVPSTLAEWLAASAPPTSHGHDIGLPDVGLLRILFYGRASTAEHQDPRTSKAWQLDLAHKVTEDRGVIVGDYFDVACSRQVPWHKRPQAAAMLQAIADPDNRIDAIVVGEYERAFDYGQLDALRPFLEHHGVQLWLPEAGGPVEFDTPLHKALMAVLAARSHAEVVRARHRVTHAMRRQTIDQGRYLGGRPPYGYRLVDAGPHPNSALARRGVRLHRLAPDPATARHVAWIFAQRLAGRSTAHIARRLDERAIPGPSGADPGRNPHRTHHGWSLRTVTEILRNPRYTGYQVWNRSSCDRTDRSPTGRRPSTRNPQHEWAISTRIAHQPLVSEQNFLAAQAIQAQKPNSAGKQHAYQLTGRLQCGLCGRRMDAHRVHNRPGYRCRHGHSSARTRPAGAPGNLYLREDLLLDRIADHLTIEGIAADPTPKQVARLVHELGLAFVCDTHSITPLQPDMTPSSKPAGSQPATTPTLQPAGPAPAEIGEPADTNHLAVMLVQESPTSTADHPAAPDHPSAGPEHGTRPIAPRRPDARVRRSRGIPARRTSPATRTAANHYRPTVTGERAPRRISTRTDPVTRNAGTTRGLQARARISRQNDNGPDPLDSRRRDPANATRGQRNPADQRKHAKNPTTLSRINPENAVG